MFIMHHHNICIYILCICINDSSSSSMQKHFKRFDIDGYLNIVNKKILLKIIINDKTMTHDWISSLSAALILPKMPLVINVIRLA